jgi:hypothetical protein
MATHTIRTDDLNGEVDAVTVVITVNGKGVEVDLAEKSVNRLTRALEPFWKVGSEADYVVERRQSATRRKTTAPSSRDDDPAAVRAWATANGIPVTSRGRVPRDVVEQYRRAM